MNLEQIVALDLETAPTMITDNPYALEPWRLKQGKAKITAITVYNGVEEVHRNDRDSDLFRCINHILKDLQGKTVICHNALFDVAWLYAHEDKYGDGYDLINGITWVDSSLISKWYSNGQEAENKYLSHSLINCCTRHLPLHDDLDEFLDVKSQSATPGQDFDYWVHRNKLDTRMTRDLFIAIWNKFPLAMVRGFLTEQKCIAPVAKGWVEGIPFDGSGAKRLHKEMEAEKIQLCKSIGVSVACLTSPKQKKELIFGDWGMEPTKLTPTGAPSTAHDVLMRLHQTSDDSRFDTLMKAIKLATLQSKYTAGFARAEAYNGVEIVYGCPRIFGTYTGRMKYKNKTTKKQDHQCSIAMHQMPRKEKQIKHLLKAPEGYGIIGIDANSQETRIMAIESGDPTMVGAYQDGKDLHSVMTSTIYGRPYQDVVDGSRSGDLEIVEERQSGKLLNLSCQYRIGSNSLAEKFFTTYEQDISQADARRFLSIYKRQYPGVVRYWDNAIESARSIGFARTVGGRRYGIEKFDWSGESSAINFPVQGGGADHCYATIAIVNRHRPDLTLCLQLHDGLYYFCPLDVIDETVVQLVNLTKGEIYGKIWKVVIPIELPYDGSVSYTSFGELQEI